MFRVVYRGTYEKCSLSDIGIELHGFNFGPGVHMESSLEEALKEADKYGYVCQMVINDSDILDLSNKENCKRLVNHVAMQISKECGIDITKLINHKQYDEIINDIWKGEIPYYICEKVSKFIGNSKVTGLLGNILRDLLNKKVIQRKYSARHTSCSLYTLNESLIKGVHFLDLGEAYKISTKVFASFQSIWKKKELILSIDELGQYVLYKPNKNGELDSIRASTNGANSWALDVRMNGKTANLRYKDSLTAIAGLKMIAFRI